MSAREEFWDLVCSHAPHLYAMLVFVTAMGVMNLAAMVIDEQSEGAFVVSVLVFVILGITGSGIAALLWRCRRR